MPNPRHALLAATTVVVALAIALTALLARSSPSLACEAAGEGWPEAGAGGTETARPAMPHNPPPPAILALDLGTHTGWAAWTGASVVSGAWDFTPRRFDGGGMRFLRFQALLRHALDDLRAERVFYEEVRAHAGTDAAHIYGGLWAVLTAHCESRQIPYAGVPVATIKRHATGKGNASKAAMLDAARHRGWNPADDNEADALWLLDAALQGVAT